MPPAGSVGLHRPRPGPRDRVGLQSLPTDALPADLARRLGRYIAELEETIDEIRTRVFGLRGAHGLQHGPAASRFPRVGADEIAANPR